MQLKILYNFKIQMENLVHWTKDVKDELVPPPSWFNADGLSWRILWWLHEIEICVKFVIITHLSG